MKEVVRAIEGVGLYPSISLIVFVLFFTTMLLWAFTIGRCQVKHMSTLPLEDDTESTPVNGDTDHAG